MPQPRWDPLDNQSTVLYSTNEPSTSLLSVHECQNAPLMMSSALEDIEEKVPDIQYGLFGRTMYLGHRNSLETPSDQRLYMNCSAPFSAILCGVQGSGKSHTLSTMLENLLIPDVDVIGSLYNAMSGLVLHFGEGGSTALPCEAAWLASSCQELDVETPAVRVYVSPSSIKTMRSVYTAALGSKVDVQPLYFLQSELDARAFMSMMSIDSSESAPLYMQVILTTLRQMGENFTYDAFRVELLNLKKSFTPGQLVVLEQRMALLTSFLDPGSAKKQAKRAPRFAPGQLTIIDLSDPFIDPGAACGIFNIICRLFIRADIEAGKVLVIDEAHKYLSGESGSTELTSTILSIIRQQRHLGMRVIISTQEPTILPPVIIDLSSVVILHQFYSPRWWNHIIKHVSADFSDTDAFDRVVRLQTGESLILAPSGVGIFGNEHHQGKSDNSNESNISRFGRRYLICKTRKRMTDDGGASVLAV